MILLGDSRKKLKSVDSESADLCITSPPYKNNDGYNDDLIIDVFRETYRIQKDDTLLFLNFGHLAEDKFRPFHVCKLVMGIGYKLNDTITWVKNHYKPIQGECRLNNLTEFIFVLYKGEMPRLDRLSIGVPYVDKSNAKRFNNGFDRRCGGNVWYIDYETITSSDQKEHNDRFPLELPVRCIKLCGYTVNTILDPFCGSGTVGVAAKMFGKNFIGVEKNKIHYDKCVKRVESTIITEPLVNRFFDL